MACGAHADRDERGEEAGRDGEARTFGDVVDTGDQFEAAAGSHDLGEQFGKTLSAAFDSRRDDSAGDDGGFEQSEIILGKVEHFGELGDFGGGAEVDGGQSQDRVVDDTEEGLDGRAWGGIEAMDGEVDRDIEHASAFGEIHAEEEDVAPAGVAEVHADGGLFAEDGVDAGGVAACEFGADAEGLIEGMAHSEHPLVASDGADAATDLVGKGLEGEAMVGGGEGAGEAVAGAVLGLVGEKTGDGLIEAAVEEVFIAREGNEAARVEFGSEREVKPVQRIEEEQGANAFVKVRGVLAKRIEGGTFVEQVGQGGRAAELFE